jgi:hypothetical protein
MLTHPWWASVAILPQFYKDRLYLKWDKIRKNENYHRTITNSAAVVQEAFKSETRIEGLKEFFDIQFETDKMRKEKLFKAIPELEEVHEWLLENL